MPFLKESFVIITEVRQIYHRPARIPACNFTVQVRRETAGVIW